MAARQVGRRRPFWGVGRKKSKDIVVGAVRVGLIDVVEEGHGRKKQGVV